MILEMKREISFYRDYKIDFIIKDANDDNKKQIDDINELVRNGIDLLIVSPNEAEQLTPVVVKVYNQGIPVIVVDRKINSPNYTAYIGADNLEIGREAGYFAIELLKGKGKVLELTGLKGSTPAIERSKGFHEIIDRSPGILTTKSIEGEWLEEKTLQITDSLFRNFKDFDLIFAHNDFMAKAASKSAKKHNIKTFIIGVDGLNTPDGGVNLVLTGSIDGTILYPTGGERSIQIAIDILTSKPYEKNVILNTYRIDNSNARTIWLQGKQVQDQQIKIDNQSEQLTNLDTIVTRKNSLLLLTYLTIILLISVVVLIYLSLRNKNKMNKVLDEKSKTINHQNKIISKQRDDSINLLIVAEEAKENKLRLFTDLSHEFRTVVTLITNPIQDLLESTKDEQIINKLKILQRSSDRLNRLTDGILRFRRLDENKYPLTFFSANISDFIITIIETFREQATKKDVTLQSDITPGIYAEFDIGVMEKIIYNLLSNAIKYTKSSGMVSVSLRAEDSKIMINIKDTGIGIPQTSLPFLFNRFYKVNNLYDKGGNEGIGIGLSLTKELLQLHGGQINVSSVENQGTVFSITIPQFHSRKGELSNLQTKSQNDTKIDTPLKHDKEKLILIVEDNIDLLMVIADIIKKHYRVITATNGKEGLHIARKHQPDLILSDILMPVMDGMQMCIEIKKHQTTCHIPVVLLTAIDSQESTIRGFDLGADAYITKPFNEFLLLSNIKNLVDSRAKLKAYFCPSPYMRELLKTKDIEDSEFLQECLNNIYENLENENYTLDNLSDKMNMSRSSLYRRLKDITSLKPVDFIKKAKLNYAAKLLLTNKNITINEICWRSGFSDTKYFSKCFFQEFGSYPKNYAEAINREK